MPKYTAQDIAYILDMNPLSNVVSRHVKLVRAGREYSGLCPFHTEKTPSFTVNDDKGFYHCFGCGAHGNAIKFTMEISGLSFLEATSALGGGEAFVIDPKLAEKRRLAALEKQKMEDKARAYKLGIARKIWGTCDDIAGTLAEVYLRERGIVSRRLPPTLRFCPVLDYYSGGVTVGHHPAMVAPVSHPDGHLMGIHMTYLSHDGRQKADVPNAKIILGAVSGGAIRLGPVAREIHVTEGIETALSVRDGLMSGRGQDISVWAGMSASICQTMNFPKDVKAVYHWIDHDKYQEKLGCGAGEYAARQLSIHAAAQGKKFYMVRPPIPIGDFNDVISQGASAL